MRRRPRVAICERPRPTLPALRRRRRAAIRSARMPGEQRAPRPRGSAVEPRRARRRRPPPRARRAEWWMRPIRQASPVQSRAHPRHAPYQASAPSHSPRIWRARPADTLDRCVSAVSGSELRVRTTARGAGASIASPARRAERRAPRARRCGERAQRVLDDSPAPRATRPRAVRAPLNSSAESAMLRARELADERVRARTSRPRSGRARRRARGARARRATRRRRPPEGLAELRR